jgi:hypothetical protein
VVTLRDLCVYLAGRQAFAVILQHEILGKLSAVFAFFHVTRNLPTGKKSPKKRDARTGHPIYYLHLSEADQWYNL